MNKIGESEPQWASKEFRDHVHEKSVGYTGRLHDWKPFHPDYDYLWECTLCRYVMSWDIRPKPNQKILYDVFEDIYLTCEEKEIERVMNE